MRTAPAGAATFEDRRDGSRGDNRDAGQRRHPEPPQRQIQRTDRGGRGKPARPRLAEPVEVAKFWKNRRGEAVIVQLREYEGHVLVDVRAHFTNGQGKLQPTAKGLSLAVLRLPELRAAIVKAETKAIELGLLGGAK